MFIGIYVQQISGERLQDHWSSGIIHVVKTMALGWVTRIFSLVIHSEGFTKAARNG